MPEDKGFLKSRLEKLGYRVFRKLGQGAQACVYLVQYEGVFLACKVSESAEVLSQEGDVLKKVHHPGIPRYIKFSRYDWGAVLLMEYVEGINMKEYLRQGTILKVTQVLDWGEELAEILCALHDMEGTVIYRDLKPENIIVRPDGRLKLVDLGCACTRKQTAFSMGGTPGYASPEQLEKYEQLSERSDVYAWGAVINEILEGCRCRSFREYSLIRKVKKIACRCIKSEVYDRPIGMRQVIQELAVQILRKSLRKIKCKTHKS